MPNTNETLGSKNLLEFKRPSILPPKNSGGNWELAEDWTVTYLGNEIVIPSGFEFDGASIPCLLRPICGDPLQVPRIYAAIVHDYIYMMHAIPRDIADDLYRNMQIMLKTTPVKAWIEWSFIRAFGWTHW